MNQIIKLNTSSFGFIYSAIVTVYGKRKQKMKKNIAVNYKGYSYRLCQESGTTMKTTDQLQNRGQMWIPVPLKTDQGDALIAKLLLIQL